MYCLVENFDGTTSYLSFRTKSYLSFRNVAIDLDVIKVE